MDEDSPERKAGRVKLEAELILENDTETDVNLTHAAIDSEASTNFVQKNGLSPTVEPISTVNRDEASLIVKIKEEIIEDTTVCTDTFLDNNDQNDTEVAPAKYCKQEFTFSEERISVKLEDEFMEENDANRNNHPSFDFTEANKEMKADDWSMMDVGCRSLLKTATSAHHNDNSVFSQERVDFKSEGNFVHKNVSGRSIEPIPPVIASKEESNIEGMSSNISDYSANNQNEEKSSLKSRRGGSFVITRNTVQKIKGYDLKMCDLFPSPSKPCSSSSHRSVSEKHTTSNCSNSLAKQTRRGYTDDISNETTSAEEHSKVQSCFSTRVQKSEPSSSDSTSLEFDVVLKKGVEINLDDDMLVRKNAASLSELTPFEFVDSSAIIEDKTATDLDVCIDENTNDVTPFSPLSPSECSAPSNKRIFSCAHCSKCFKTKHALWTHSLRHSDEAVHTCPQCSLSFRHKYTLKKHLLKHSNKRAYSCDRCPAVFKRLEALKLHAVVHSDDSHSSERPFSCELCFARFKIKRTLTQHMYTHSNLDRFSCKLCSSVFQFKSHLRIHMLIHFTYGQ